jgi:hypothetical protein
MTDAVLIGVGVLCQVRDGAAQVGAWHGLGLQLATPQGQHEEDNRGDDDGNDDDDDDEDDDDVDDGDGMVCVLMMTLMLVPVMMMTLMLVPVMMMTLMLVQVTGASD